MKLGICADPATLATLPVDAGHDYIEGFTQAVLAPEKPEAEFAAQAAALRRSGEVMPASNRFLPADLKVVGPAVDQARLERYAATAFRRAREVGMTMIVFGSAGARMVPEGFSAVRAFEQYVEALRRFGPLAEKEGVTVLVEPLNRGECNLVNTLREGAEAVQRANSPGVKLLVDIFHMLRNGESPDEISRPDIAALVRHAHIAENQARAAPGTHGEDFRPFLRELHRVGYVEGLTVEADWKNLPEEVGPTLIFLRAQLAQAS
jgi:sugar phosphate isomerase/epimerase